MVDYNKLKSRIIEKFGTAQKFAEALGKSKNYVSRLMTGHKVFTHPEVSKWCEVLNLTDDDIISIFFA